MDRGRESAKAQAVGVAIGPVLAASRPLFREGRPPHCPPDYHERIHFRACHLRDHGHGPLNPGAPA